MMKMQKFAVYLTFFVIVCSQSTTKEVLTQESFNKLRWISKNGVRHNHLIHVFKGNFDIIEIVTQKNINLRIEKFISVVNDTTVDLVTGFRFLPGVCSSAVYETINRFSTNTMTLHNKTFFPDKYRNFHGCPLKVGKTLTRQQ
jgi:hypothetical protein